ncbi:hypothetical protein BKA25_001794 [Actinoalloteichus hymeniacidonis]|uniref:Uncharacterized protein n=1 Tax=Actinoalloteichus hymeniacidonis TaxID=340345 RepID=A0AAC9HRT4_9PSEU|nr:hypothetical protein TL08_18285 [Actinoalloteichus hymeniacidonis]MBB5907478.1 hypothetical protein [Actinoalloteichus hymeniacidonis]
MTESRPLPLFQRTGDVRRLRAKRIRPYLDAPIPCHTCGARP